MVPQMLILATRSSRLALVQTEEAVNALRTVLPDAGYAISLLTSPGDRDQHTPLTDAGIPDDFFTRDLDEALLNGDADLAVHSAKDLPESMRDGLTVAALLPAREMRDALVLRKDWPAHKTPLVIGASSPNREQHMRAQFPDTAINPIRGSIEQRLEQLDNGAYDAVVMAACALDRLGMSDRISVYLPYDATPRQGQLAIVTRSDQTDLLHSLQPLTQFQSPKKRDINAYTLFVGTNPRPFSAYSPLIHWPLIELVSRPLPDRARILESQWNRAAGVLFPSRFAVHSFMEALSTTNVAGELSSKKLLAVGPTTEQALQQYGLNADASATSYGGIGELTKHLSPALAGHYLYPCSSAAPIEERKRALAEWGITLQPECFYDNRTRPYRELPALPFQRVLFTSTSTVRAYFEAYPEERHTTRSWLAIGPSTAASLREIGLTTEIIIYGTGKR